MKAKELAALLMANPEMEVVIETKNGEYREYREFHLEATEGALRISLPE